jgi:hypothetical protein
MRSADYIGAAALILLVSGTGMAQTSAPSNSVPALAPATDVGTTRTHWTTAGFIGANLGSDASNLSIRRRRSLDFGGQVGYLWKGIVGGEFLAAFTPSFGVSSAALPDKPRVNSYMANALGVIPIGGQGQFQPYLSGGYGGMQMKFANVPTSSTTTTSNSQLTAGADIGSGIMVFAGRIGFRSDFRYFRAMTNNTPSGTPGDQASQMLLSGLGFWRTNVGVAFQF